MKKPSIQSKNTARGRATLTESSKMRLVAQNSEGDHSYKIYRDAEYSEFIVKFYDGGKHQSAADYHTGSKSDAIDTAEHGITSRAKKKQGTMESKKSKPDFLDLDGDGDTKEPMKKAAKKKSSEKNDEWDEYSADEKDSKKHKPQLKKNRGHKHTERIDELSNDTLGSYKKRATADASSADKEGDTERANKRFRGVVKATKKQFDNDAKGTKKQVDEHFARWSRMLKQQLNEGLGLSAPTKKNRLDESLTVAASIGDKQSTDTVTITAHDEDAHKLLQILQNAGMGTGVPSSSTRSTTAAVGYSSQTTQSNQSKDEQVDVESDSQSSTHQSAGVSPSSSTAGGAAANDNIDSPGAAVTSMPMPRGMAFSVQPEEQDIPLAPAEVSVADPESVLNSLEHGDSASKTDGDAELAQLKKSLVGITGSNSSEVKETEKDETKDKKETESKKETDEESDEKQSKEESDEKEESDDSDDEEKEKKKVEESSYKMTLRSGDIRRFVAESDTAAKSIAKKAGAVSLKKIGKKVTETKRKKKSYGDAEVTTEQKSVCEACGGDIIGEGEHTCDSHLNEWANTPNGYHDNTSFVADTEYMTDTISGGLNNKKSTGQTTNPVIYTGADRQSSVKPELRESLQRANEFNLTDLRGLAGIKK
jgi:hypothetical protein